MPCLIIAPLTLSLGYDVWAFSPTCYRPVHERLVAPPLHPVAALLRHFIWGICRTPVPDAPQGFCRVYFLFNKNSSLALAWLVLKMAQLKVI